MVTVPGFLVPGLLVPGLSTNSYTRSRDRPGRTQQTRIFCGKALLLTSSGAREQESKRARALLLTSLGARAQESKSARVQECKRFIAYIFRSKRARAQECKRASALSLTSLGARVQESKMQEQKQESKRARESMAKPRPFFRRIILRLGLVTP
jgi:hypothetical protein